MRLVVVTFFVMALVSGCGGSPFMQSVMDLGRRVSPVMAENKAASPVLNPGFSYLRAKIDERVAYFALGYVDPHPDGDIEVWYSGEKEVLRLQHGRVVGAVGMATEWQGVSLSDAPKWQTELNSGYYTRVRDVSPGYRYGIKEQIRVQRILPPELAKTMLLGVEPQSLTWFEETIEGGGDLPSSRYALRMQSNLWQVFYSETCLAPELCFSWQRWQP